MYDLAAAVIQHNTWPLHGGQPDVIQSLLNHPSPQHCTARSALQGPSVLLSDSKSEITLGQALELRRVFPIDPLVTGKRLFVT